MRPENRWWRRAGVGLLLALLTAPFAPGEDRLSVRRVALKVAAPDALRGSDAWKVDLNLALRSANLRFRDRLGIVVHVEETAYWRAEGACGSLLERLDRLAAQVPRGSCDIIAGLLAPDGEIRPPYGIADYRRGCILIKLHPSWSTTAILLAHEIAHLFGAVDIDERGSIMGLRRRGTKIDPFTAEIMALNRGRSFGEGEFPLAPAVQERALSLYLKRLAEHRAELGLEIVIAHLLFEKAKRAEPLGEPLFGDGLNEEAGRIFAVLGALCSSSGQPRDAETFRWWQARVR